MIHTPFLLLEIGFQSEDCDTIRASSILGWPHENSTYYLRPVITLFELCHTTKLDWLHFFRGSSRAPFSALVSPVFRSFQGGSHPDRAQEGFSNPALQMGCLDPRSIRVRRVKGTQGYAKTGTQDSCSSAVREHLVRYTNVTKSAH